MDVFAYWTHTRGKADGLAITTLFYVLLCTNREFRTVYYYRLGNIGRFLAIFLKPHPGINLNRTFINDYDGGLYIAHGESVRLEAEKIGKNLWVHQNVTFGLAGEGRPIIGDNVYVGCGVAIVGSVKVGDYAKIGANATVVDDVPEYGVAVSPKAKILKIERSPEHNYADMLENLYNTIAGRWGGITRWQPEHYRVA